MILRSLRLTLYLFTKNDHSYFHDLNIDTVRNFLWDGQEVRVEATKDILEKNEEYFKEKSFGLWKLESKVNNKIIGYAGLWYFFNEPQPQVI